MVFFSISISFPDIGSCQTTSEHVFKDTIADGSAAARSVWERTDPSSPVYGSPDPSAGPDGPQWRPPHSTGGLRPTQFALAVREHAGKPEEESDVADDQETLQEGGADRGAYGP